MKKYIFLPKSYEQELANDLVNFLNEGGRFTIVTGVYKKFDNVVTNNNTLVSSKLITGDIVFIKQDYEDVFTKTKYEIIGFCLEGDLQRFALKYYEKLLTLNDVIMFDTAESYLDYVKKI
jgi:hypothetical protein